MAYSIPEILARFTRGQGIPSYHQGDWGEGEESFENENIFMKPDFDITDVETEMEKLNVRNDILKAKEKNKVNRDGLPEGAGGPKTPQATDGVKEQNDLVLT